MKSKMPVQKNSARGGRNGGLAMLRNRMSMRNRRRMLKKKLAKLVRKGIKFETLDDVNDHFRGIFRDY